MAQIPTASAQPFSKPIPQSEPTPYLAGFDTGLQIEPASVAFTYLLKAGLEGV